MMKPTDDELIQAALRAGDRVPPLDDLAAERLARRIRAAAAPDLASMRQPADWQADVVGVGRYSVPLAAAAGLLIWLLASVLPGSTEAAAAEASPAQVFLAAVEGSATGEMVVDATLGAATPLTLSWESR